MKGTMLALWILLIAGISFAAVYPNAQLERTYQLQLCKIQHSDNLLDYSTSYDGTVEQYEVVFSYSGWWGIFEQDRKALESAGDKKGLMNAIKTSNKNVRDANSMYSKISRTYAKRGATERQRVSSEIKAALKEYGNCRLCAMNPSSVKCCRIIEGSERATLEIKEARILEDGSLTEMGTYTVTLYEGETFTSSGGAQYTLNGISQKLNSVGGTCSVSDSEADIWIALPNENVPGGCGNGGPTQEGMWRSSEDYTCMWHNEIVVSDISEDLTK